MPCYHPLKAVKSTERSEKAGKHLIAFSSTKALVQEPLPVVALRSVHRLSGGSLPAMGHPVDA